MQRANAAELYGEFYGIYRDATAENIAEMARQAVFTEIGRGADYAEVDSDKTLILTFMDRTARALSHMERSIAEGRYPQAENEIAAAPGFFRELGILDPRIGDTVTLAFRTDLKSMYQPGEFVICGFLRQSDIETNVMAACTSEAFYEKCVAGEDRRYKVLFRLDDSVGITFDNREEVLRKLASRCGIDGRNVAANDNYLRWKLDPGTGTIAVCAVVCAGIIFFSVIVIYNIFQVGVIQKIQAVAGNWCGAGSVCPDHQGYERGRHCPENDRGVRFERAVAADDGGALFFDGMACIEKADACGGIGLRGRGDALPGARKGRRKA